MNDNRLLIIDGNAMLNVFYFASLPEELKKEDNPELYGLIDQNQFGIYRNAIIPFLQMMETMTERTRSTHIAVVFDTGVDSFRKRAYPGYKATRQPKQYPLQEQIFFLKDSLKRAGVSVYTSQHFEGDDLAASIAAQEKANYSAVFIVTTDHDYFQLAGGNVWIALYVPQGKGIEKYPAAVCIYNNYFWISESTVVSSTGIRPEQIPDMKGLCGDRSDNIPGVKGVGNMVIPVLRNYGTVENLYGVLESCDEDAMVNSFRLLGVKQPGRLYKALTADHAKGSALFCKKLATMQKNLDLRGVRPCPVTVMQDPGMLWFKSFISYSAQNINRMNAAG